MKSNKDSIDEALKSKYDALNGSSGDGKKENRNPLKLPRSLRMLAAKIVLAKWVVSRIM